MLEIRLDLLESLLDLSWKYPEPEFRPGEVTIIDMSDPFMDANTACLVFKIRLQRYLQSKAPGKIVVLNEARKVRIALPKFFEQEADLDVVHIESARGKTTQRLHTLHHPSSTPLWCPRRHLDPGAHVAYGLNCSVLSNDHSPV